MSDQSLIVLLKTHAISTSRLQRYFTQGVDSRREIEYFVEIHTKDCRSSMNFMAASGTNMTGLLIRMNAWAKNGNPIVKIMR